MILVENLQELKLSAKGPADLKALPRPRVLTTGVFDGLHLAHQLLVRKVVEHAHSNTDGRGTAMVLTFPNHPLSVLAPPYAPKILIDPAQKVRLLERMGIDLALMPRFTHEFAAVEAEEFVEQTLVEGLGVDHMIVGFDYRFGKDGRGDTNLLKEKAKQHGFGLEVLPAIYHDKWTVSSTHIRELIDTGRLRLAAELLGRPYELSGPVLHGYGRGTSLGFPTANLRFDPDFAMPPSGVYAVRVAVGESHYKGMMNIGSSPTFEGTEYRPEVFLLDFEGDLYESTLRIQFIDRLREERKFESAHALQQRLRVDETLARAILEAHPENPAK